MIKMMVAEEKVLFQIGIVEALRNDNDIEVISICNNREDALNNAIKLKPHIIFISNNILTFESTEMLKQIREQAENTRIVLICHDNTMYEDPLSLLSLELEGYIKDDLPTNVLSHLIHDIVEGHRSISPEMQDKLLEEYLNSQKKSSVIHDLSKRQIEILSLAARGFSNRDIAENLYIAETTVKTQMSVIIRKLGVHNRQRAAIVASEKGIITNW